MLYWNLLFGLAGGLARGFVGILKAYQKKEKLNWQYFLITIFASSVIGAVASIFVNGDYRLSIIAGYAGMDILENVYKIGLKR